MKRRDTRVTLMFSDLWTALGHLGSLRSAGPRQIRRKDGRLVIIAHVECHQLRKGEVVPDRKRRPSSFAPFSAAPARLKQKTPWSFAVPARKALRFT